MQDIILVHIGYCFRLQVESCGDGAQKTIEGSTISSNGDSNNKNNGKSLITPLPNNAKGLFTL